MTLELSDLLNQLGKVWMLELRKLNHSSWSHYSLFKNDSVVFVWYLAYMWVSTKLVSKLGHFALLIHNIIRRKQGPFHFTLFTLSHIYFVLFF